jgi:hypothetical protein
MSSKASEESYLSPEPWTSGNPWGSGIELPGAYPPSPEPHSLEASHSAPESLSAALKARKSEYIRKKSMKIKIGTWNVAAIHGTEKDLGAWFVKGYGINGLLRTFQGSRPTMTTTTMILAATSISSLSKHKKRG